MRSLPTKDYEFIVIGGGTAGSLLARLLAQRGSGQVALIEAGRAATDVRTRVPAYYPRTFGSPLDWGFKTSPQSGLNGRRLAWPRGKIVGGSGAINALIYLQAADADFNRWAQHGCAGWNWQSIRSSMTPPSDRAEYTCPHSGLAIGKLIDPHPWSRVFLTAAESWGFKLRTRWFQAENHTCGMYSLTQHNGQRVHTGQQLSETCLPNLDVYQCHEVIRLKLHSQRIVALEMRDGNKQSVSLPTHGKVILSAGTVGSPTILLRSGIGPAQHLQAIGLPVSHELPGVGENLQDHLVYPLIFKSRRGVGLPHRFSGHHRQTFRQHGQGPLASNIAEAGALFSAGDSGVPEYQLHFTPTHYLKYPFTSTTNEHFSIALTDLHPRSRGTLRLQSDGPEAAPLIDPSYLRDSVDVDRLISGITICRELAQQPSLRELIADELLPGSKREQRQAISRSLRTFSQSIYHPVGTCRMGSDAMAVVTPHLQVHGIANLHIADASVLPDLPSANTNAVTLYIAARAANNLLSDA